MNDSDFSVSALFISGLYSLMVSGDRDQLTHYLTDHLLAVQERQPPSLKLRMKASEAIAAIVAAPDFSTFVTTLCLYLHYTGEYAGEAMNGPPLFADPRYKELFGLFVPVRFPISYGVR